MRASVALDEARRHGPDAERQICGWRHIHCPPSIGHPWARPPRSGPGRGPRTGRYRRHRTSAGAPGRIDSVAGPCHASSAPLV